MKHLHSSDHWRDSLPKILQLAGIGMWELTLSEAEATLQFSRAVKELFGYEDGALGSQWALFLERVCHPEYKDALKKKIADAVQSLGCAFHFEFPAWSNKTREWRWVYIFGQSESVPGNAMVRLFGGVQDIHDRRERQKQLQRQQQEALQSIELHKAVLEQQIKERTELLRDVHTRVESILGTASPFNLAEPPAPLAPVDVYDEVDVLYAQGLHKAFDIITEKMSWYKAIIDSIPFPIAVTDMNNHWMYLNRPGLRVAEAESLRELFGNPALRWSADSCMAEARSGQHGHFTFHHKKSDRFYQGQASNLFDSDGHTIGHIETMQDVTEVHRADERTRLMLNAMPLGCTFWDRDFKTIDCNDAAARLLGAPDKETFLTEFYALSPPYQPDGIYSPTAAEAHIQKAFDEGTNHFEWEHMTFSGERIPVDVTLVRINWRGENVVVGYMADLRELRAAQAELDKERLLLKEVLASSPVSMMILVGDIVRFVTPFTMEFLGVQVGDSIYDFHETPEQGRQIEEELREKRRLNWRPMNFASVSGTVHEMLGNAFFTEYYGEEALIFWLVDVTDMRAKERELLLARDAAEESTRAKSEFLANMSHEIRTPLNAILGMTHLILRTELTPKQRDYMEKTEQSGKSLLRIINDILDFSKIEAGKLEMERVPFSVKRVIRDVYAVISQSAREKGLEILFAIPRDLPEKVVGDPLRLHQVLLNLAGNAVKFTKQGHVMISLDVRKVNAAGVDMDFTVKDTGIGMSQAQISRLFSPFSQADTSTTRQYGGTGLGLAICKRLVEMMGGAIWCESAPGRGTAFHFSTRFGLTAPVPLLSAAHFANLEILLLGDNSQDLAMLSSMLQAMGCTVSMVSNREQCTALLRRSAGFDLMIMDWMDPESRVPETWNFLKEKTRKHLPPLLLALPENLPVETELLPFNIATALIKPITPSSLLDEINKLLEKRNSSAEASVCPIDTDGAMRALVPFRGERILLVEDNPINQMVALELLELAGLTVDIAGNGREAIGKAKTNEYALILMDIQMPEMDGFTAARALRAEQSFSQVPIIAMTALAMQGDREKSLAAGMDDHVTKPIDAAELYAALARWLPGR